MTSRDVREKYLSFFEKKGHKRIKPSPLVLENDTTTLFTSAGMQPLIPYLKGELHPKGKRLVDSQPSLRLQDIEEVGDNRHTTFFEMLGNWSLGDYFKEEQLSWCWEFFTKELRLPKDKLYVSVFEGTEEVPKDEESFRIWKELGIPEGRIHFYGVDKNWWSRSGTPENMPEGEIGGPDSEVFYDFGSPIHEGCHPNCDCGRFLEIGNSVFIQYQKGKDGSLEELLQKNVDFGGGLERIVTAVNGNPDIFRIDIFSPVIELLEKETGIKYSEESSQVTDFRIIADHMRASVAIASEGILPSNKLQGYVLRRLIRRAATKIRQITSKSSVDIVDKIAEVLGAGSEKESIVEEVYKFEKILLEGVRLVKQNPKIDPFELYQSFGIPYEISHEIYSGIGRKLTERDLEEFKEKLSGHQEKSRVASSKIFKGGLEGTSEATTRFHTATHLLHASLREILGEHVMQKGSNITSKRLRFDFSHPKRLTEEEIKKIEEIVNDQIKKDLPVSFEVKSLEEAKKEGALAFFSEKYGDQVKVYTIGDPKGKWFSKEVCGGPHVTRTSEIGRVKITKEESVSSGVRRIYAQIEK